MATSRYGEITFSSFLEMCVQVVDRDRIRKQFRDASRKLAFLAGVLLPAVTVLISLVGGLVLWEVEGWAYVDCFYLVLSELTSTHIPLAHEKHPTDRFGKLVACLVGLCSLAVFCCFIGVLAGPLLEPIGEQLRLAPKEVDRLDVLLGGGDDSANGLVGMTLGNWLPAASASSTVGRAVGAMASAVETAGTRVSNRVMGLTGLATTTTEEKFELVIKQHRGAREALSLDVEMGRAEPTQADLEALSPATTGDNFLDAGKDVELEVASRDTSPTKGGLATFLDDTEEKESVVDEDDVEEVEQAHRDPRNNGILEILDVADPRPPPPSPAEPPRPETPKERADREGAQLQWSITEDDIIDDGRQPPPDPIGYHLCAADCTS